MVQPFGSNVLLHPLEKEQQTEGGIFLPDTTKQPLHKAKVLAAGPGTTELPMEASAGDIIYYQPHPSDQPFKDEGQECILVHQTRILAKIL